MRQVDQHAISELGIPGATLMENAGRAAAEAALAWLAATKTSARSRRVAVVCGKGGNGGDGFVLARHLKRHGVRCDVFITCQPGEVQGEAGAKLRELQKAAIRPTVLTDAGALGPALARADLVVDALLGTGTRGEVGGLVAAVIEAINAAGQPVLALDIPSGLSADASEMPAVAVRADRTVTFAGLKRALVMPPTRALAGQVTVADIGIPDEALRRGITTFVLEAADVAAHFRPRPADAHKGTYGHLLVIAGSIGKTGAAALAANAALRAGAGLVTAATAATQQPILASLVLEAMTAALPDGAPGYIGEQAWGALGDLIVSRDAVAVGPGLGLDAGTQSLARRLVSEVRAPMVIDADALTALAGHLDLLPKAPAPRCVTPHPGELARMLSIETAEVQRDRIEVARRFAITSRAYVVLKGAASVIARPDGTVLLNPTGNPGLASGGSGDVLTGMVGAFLARGLAPDAALESAVYLHGLAGDVAAEQFGEESMIARDVIAALPEAFSRIRTAPSPER